MINRFLPYPLKHDVPHSSNLLLFLIEVATSLLCSDSTSLGPSQCIHLAVWSALLLLSGQQMYSTDVLQEVFFAAKPEGSHTFLSHELHELVRGKRTYFYCGVTLFFLKRLVLLQMVGYSMYIILVVLKLFL